MRVIHTDINLKPFKSLRLLDLPETHVMELLHKELTDQVIGAFFKVYNTLGYGFLEKVYENALAIELQKNGLACSNQNPVRVFYDGFIVGNYYADLVVNDTIIVELKAAQNLCLEHECQLINYLKATEMEVGLLLNFGAKPQFKRKIFTNSLKQNGTLL